MTTREIVESLMRSIIDSICVLKVFAIYFIPSPRREIFLTKIHICTETAIRNFKYPNEGSFFVLEVLNEDLKLQAMFAQDIIDAAKIQAAQPTAPNTAQCCDVATHKDIESLGDKIITAVSKAAENAEGKIAALKNANAELLQLQAEGYFKFTSKVDAQNFAAFIFIMALGNRKKAAYELKIPQRSFYDRVNKWQGMGPEYKRMFRMVEWRKKIGRKIIVQIPDSVLGTKNKNQPENPEIIRDVKQSWKDRAAEAKDHSELLRDILGVLKDQDPEDKDPQKWQNLWKELVEIITAELPQ